MVLGEDGRYRIREGALVTVEVVVKTKLRRHLIALSDELPAGFEPVTRFLNYGRGRRNDPFAYLLGRASTYKPLPSEHRNIRSNRVESYATEIEPGNYQFRYSVRATKKGNYIAPPAKVAQIYRQEVFGRSKSEKVIIE